MVLGGKADGDTVQPRHQHHGAKCHGGDTCGTGCHQDPLIMQSSIRVEMMSGLYFQSNIAELGNIENRASSVHDPRCTFIFLVDDIC